MNIYDFDNTIYFKDSTIEFYKFCLKWYPNVIRCIPKQLIGLFFYILNIFSKKKFKEYFFSFLKYVPNLNLALDEFWNIEEKNICNWYLEKKSKNDVIITASPEFLITPIARRLGITYVIASKVDETNGIFLSENCYGEEKLKRLMECNILSSKEVEEFYSDSYTDKPLADIAKCAYLVKQGEVKEWSDTSSHKRDVLELIRYGFWGGITTILNLLLFILCINVGIPYLISNVGTYFIAVSVSYFINKIYVFQNNKTNKSIIEILKYFMVRVFSVIFDSALLWICVEVCMWNILLSKFAVSVFVIILTYFLNKLYVFKEGH